VTCTGFNIIDATLAICWGDSELYSDATPSRHRCKIAVNALTLMAGAGTGLVGLLKEGEEAIADSVSFDAALEDLPGRLRQATRALVEHRIAARSSSQVYFLVGHSHRLGRIVGAVFHEQRDFEPTITPSFSAPSVEVDDIVDEQAVVCAVQAQMLALQKRTPAAGRGAVVMATITPAAITARPIFDLERGVMLRRPIDLRDEARRAPLSTSASAVSR
jgi:hypothetical protein